jgi:hypothetical protein
MDVNGGFSISTLITCCIHVDSLLNPVNVATVVATDLSDSPGSIYLDPGEHSSSPKVYMEVS